MSAHIKYLDELTNNIETFKLYIWTSCTQQPYLGEYLKIKEQTTNFTSIVREEVIAYEMPNFIYASLAINLAQILVFWSNNHLCIYGDLDITTSNTAKSRQNLLPRFGNLSKQDGIQPIYLLESSVPLLIDHPD
ncbi:17176_t:CDS:2, partial [Gigaspora margarita]